MKYFDKQNNRLVFIGNKATPDFWDNLWDNGEIRKAIEKGRSNRFVSDNTKQFIPAPPSRKILEGGCGTGQFVYSLSLAGYDAYGIDFAEKTVKKINEAMPDMKVSVGDVRNIPFPDSFFDGYWSLGVIEHFFDGYGPITREMTRVIKPGGYLFLTFPYMSPLRRLKAMLGSYPRFRDGQADIKDFYQFALDHRRTVQDIEKSGFVLVHRKSFDGIKGLKDEIGIIKPMLQRVYDGKSSVSRLVSGAISIVFSPVSSHSILLIFRKV